MLKFHNSKTIFQLTPTSFSLLRNENPLCEYFKHITHVEIERARRKCIYSGYRYLKQEQQFKSFSLWRTLACRLLRRAEWWNRMGIRILVISKRTIKWK